VPPVASLLLNVKKPLVKEKKKTPGHYQELAAIIARYATDSGQYSTAIQGLYLSKKVVTDKPLYLAQWPCIALVVQGEKSVTLGQEVHRYGVGDYLLVSLDLPVISQVTKASKDKPNLGIGMAIHPHRLHQLLNRITLRDRILKMNEVKGISVNKAPASLLDAFLRLLRLLDHPQDIEAMAPLIEEEILYHVLTGPYGQQLLRFAREDTPGNKIAKAISWLQKNYKATLKINVLASAIGMSESSLHEHFKSVTFMTPMQYQKQLRLHEARKLMLINQLDASEAGFEVGYQSPAQFSREYSRLYGNSPLRDIQQLRVKSNSFA
jgi:AraC-like DNA-binding protein